MLHWNNQDLNNEALELVHFIKRCNERKKLKMLPIILPLENPASILHNSALKLFF